MLWIVDVYGFLVAGSLIMMGTLGDRVGRRRVLMIGAAAFGIASIAAAYATSARMLIAARAVQGVAGATFAPSTLSLIRNMFDDARERTVAISVWATSYSVGTAAGPLLGGVLLTHFRWGSVFLPAVPVMLLLLALGPGLLPEFRDPDARGMDVPSAALSLGATLLVIFGLKRIAQDGVQLSPMLAMSIGAGLGVVFVRRQSMLREALIDLRLLGARTLQASLLVYALGTFVALGSAPAAESLPGTLMLIATTCAVLVIVMAMIAAISLRHVCSIR